MGVDGLRSSKITVKPKTLLPLSISLVECSVTVELAVLKLSCIVASIGEVVGALTRHGSAFEAALVARGLEFIRFPMVDSEAVFFVPLVLSVVDVAVCEGHRSFALLEAIFELAHVDCASLFQILRTEAVSQGVFELSLVEISVGAEHLSLSGHRSSLELSDIGVVDFLAIRCGFFIEEVLTGAILHVLSPLALVEIAVLVVHGAVATSLAIGIELSDVEISTRVGDFLDILGENWLLFDFNQASVVSGFLANAFIFE